MYRSIKIGAMMAMIISLTACPKEGSVKWKDTYWLLTEIDGRSVTDDQATRPVYLHLPEGPNGQVEGFAGCNRFFGTCTLDGERLQFSRMARTKMMCPQMATEEALFSTLAAAEGYQLAGKKLHLTGNGKILASFVPMEEKP